MKTNNNSAVGSNWEDVKKEYFTPEEIAESELRVALIGELVNARKEKGITQQQLEAMTGIRQPVIARIESGATHPQITTVIKLLRALGKKLAIVPESV